MKRAERTLENDSKPTVQTRIALIEQSSRHAVMKRLLPHLAQCPTLSEKQRLFTAKKIIVIGPRAYMISTKQEPCYRGENRAMPL